MITALTGFTQRPVTANGISINAVTGGAGPPILLLHGWPETWWEWHKVMPLLAARASPTVRKAAMTRRPWRETRMG